MDIKFKILFCIATVLQSMRMSDAAIAGNNVVYTRSAFNQPPMGGIAVDHPAQATIYAKRGKLNVLIPFEFTIIPLTQNGIEPEVPSHSSTPISGSISSQPNSNYYRANQNVYRPAYYQTSTYPWNNNNNNRGFYIPASPPMSSTYQPFIQPTHQYQNGYRPIIYQQQLPANTYRSQYYSPNSNAVYAPSYQQQTLRRTEVRPWPQYNRSDRPNQPQTQQQQQQQQLPQPAQTNWSTTNTKPINISQMNSIQPPNTAPVPVPSNNKNNNQSTSVAANSTTPTTMTAETASKMPVTTITHTGNIPTGKEQPAMPTDSVMGPSNLNNGNGDTQMEGPKSNAGPSETHLDKKEQLPEAKSSVPQNNGEANGGGKVDSPQSSHTEPATALLDNNNNAGKKTENTNHEQA